MAATKRRRTKRRSAKRRKHAVARRNPPTARARRRRGHRRNPMIAGLSVNGVVARVKHGVVHGAAIVGGEVAARLVRSRVFGKKPGEMLGGAIEVATGIVAGMIVQKVLGADIGQSVTDGAFAGVFRVAIKQSGAPIVAEVLGDADGRRRFVIRNGKVIPVDRLNGYVGNPGNTGLNGYVGNPGNDGQLNGFEDQDEIYGVN